MRFSFTSSWFLLVVATPSAFVVAKKGKKTKHTKNKKSIKTVVPTFVPNDNDNDSDNNNLVPIDNDNNSDNDLIPIFVPNDNDNDNDSNNNLGPVLGGGTSEFNAAKLEGPCCNCISFNNQMDCIKHGTICVECATIVTEAEGFSTNVYWPIIPSNGEDNKEQNKTQLQLPLPVLSWGHGLNNDGSKLDKLRRNMFVFLANLGFVVVAHRLDHGWPDENADYQLKAIDELYISKEFGYLADRGGKTVLAGYSNGVSCSTMR